EEYRRKADAADPIAQSGRGSTFRAVEFLHVVRQTVALLAAGPECEVVDVGCGNGLVDIVLSGCCRSVLAVEPVPELAAHARANWYDADELSRWWEPHGGTARRHELAAGDPDRDHRFHLVVTLGR